MFPTNEMWLRLVRARIQSRTQPRCFRFKAEKGFSTAETRSERKKIAQHLSAGIGVGKSASPAGTQKFFRAVLSSQRDWFGLARLNPVLKHWAIFLEGIFEAGRDCLRASRGK